MRSERQVEALKDVGSIPTRPTHGIIETGTSFIPFTGKSYRTGQCNAQNPESACVVSAARWSKVQFFPSGRFLSVTQLDESNSLLNRKSEVRILSLRL